jgi:hypothetical protein
VRRAEVDDILVGLSGVEDQKAASRRHELAVEGAP